MEKDLVLGACGTIGKWFSGDNVIGADRYVPETSGGKFIAVDLTNDEDLEFLFKNKQYDKVFQFAADSGRIDYILDTQHFFGNSTLLNLQILKALREFNPPKKVIWPSSFYRYDIINSYGLEKRYNEELFRRNLSKDIKLIIPILWPTYGPRCDIQTKNEKVITMICRKVIEAEDGDTIRLNLHPFDGRHFIYIGDAITAIKKMSEFDEDLELDLGGIEFINFERVVNDIIKISNKSLNIEFKGTSILAPVYPNMKTTLSLLDWNPETSFYDGILIAYRWIARKMEAWNALHRAEYL